MKRRPPLHNVTPPLYSKTRSRMQRALDAKLLYLRYYRTNLGLAENKIMSRQLVAYYLPNSTTLCALKRTRFIGHCADKFAHAL